MLISHSHKFIFIKTKKTGGSSLESIIVDNFFDPEIDMCTGSPGDGTPRINVPPRVGMEPDGHRPWQMVKNLVTEEQWNSYHKFTIERSPWAKVASDFYWKRKNGKFTQHGDDVLDFKDYLKVMPDPPVNWHLYTENNIPVVDTVIQYDQYADNLLKLFNDVLMLPLDKNTIVFTRKKSGLRKLHYTQLFTKVNEIDLVSKMFANEINYFGYLY